MESQKCNKCNINKKLEDFYYIKNENRYNKICISCKKENHKNNYEMKKKEEKIIPLFKSCKKCKTEKDINQFPVCSKKKDRHNIYCYDCYNKNQKKYRTSIKEEFEPGLKRCPRCSEIKPFEDFMKFIFVHADSEVFN
jgi:hypothetical protein